MRQFVFVCMAAALLRAGPPGAMVRTKVQVPSALHTGTFSQDRYLNLPPGFQVSLFAALPGARFLTMAANGDVFVSQAGAGKVSLLRPDPKGGVPQSFTYVSGLASPHGLAFHSVAGRTYLYVAESSQVVRYAYSDGNTSGGTREIIVGGLPSTGGHTLKNIVFDSDDNLYVSIGSSCNVCASDTTSTPERAAIYIYRPDGSGGRLFARGLRNAERLAILPSANQLFVVMNNRDDIPYPLQDGSGNYGKVLTSYVDDNPPDLFTAVRDGGNYGWPFCNSSPAAGFDGMPFNPDYDTNRDAHVDCATMDIPNKGIQAHSAPLGLSFLEGSTFAPPYLNGAVVALHGSWDRSTPTGYKLIWYPVGDGLGGATDLVSGWIDPTSKSVWGRPVAAVPDNSGGLLITDDYAGVIYRLTYSPAALSSASGYALLAPESIASIYGANLGSQTASAPSPQWPVSLAGVSVMVQDVAGNSRQAPVAYVSSKQINFQIPAGTAIGTASLTVQNQTGSINEGFVTIAAVAPSLFSANGDGTGAAAATAIRVVLPTGIQSAVPVYTCPNGVGSCTTVPISLGVDTPIYVSFFGTGIRGFSSLSNVHVSIGGVAAPVVYAGPQGTWPGLDQVNVALPLSLRGAGEVDAVLNVDGQAANTVRIAVQ